MQKWKVPLLVLLIFIIALFLRTYRLTELPPGLYPDEAMNGSNAIEANATGNYKLYYPENNGREGLFINIQAQALRLLVPRSGGLAEPWMLRIVSALFGTLTVLGMYFLGKELFRNSQFTIHNSELTDYGLRISKSGFIGFAAMFFTATSFWHIMFSRIGFRAIMAPFCLVWGIALFLIALRKAREQRILAAGLIALIAGLIFGAGFHTYIAYRVAPLILLAAIPFFRKESGFWRVAGVFVLGTFLAGLPIGLYYLQNPADFLGRTAQVSVFSSESPATALAGNIVKTIGMFNVAGDFNPRHNIPGAPQLFWPVGILFLIGIPLVLKGFWREFPKFFITGTFALMTLPVIVSNEGLPHALRAILLIPPVMLTAALGASWLYEKLVPSVNIRVMGALLGFAVAVLLVNSYRSYFRTFADHPDTPGAFAANYAELARAIRALPPEVPKYVVVYAGGVDVRGIPMPSETIMYMTQSFTPDEQAKKNIHYVLPAGRDTIPAHAIIFELR